jgi:hemoglobin
MTPSPRTRPVFIPPGGPPQGSPPSPLILPAMGEDGVFQMIEDLYAELKDSSVRHLFPEDMVAASRKSGAFFVQLLGGRPLFSQQFGPPRLRQRHIPFEIDQAARDEWIACFQRTLENAEERYGFPAEHLDGFRAFLASFSNWMINAD